MAEVFKAKSYGVEGFEKIIAIKRILPTMGEDRDFIKMFIDEAKIAGQLAHANICQIFELGRIDGSHFIAMEYIWGKDLLQIQNRLRKIKQQMPIPMACFSIAKVLEGLDYAHRKRDPLGRPLEIVHRDCSPQNVLVSYEGEVKVIDFGIAKATSRNSRTMAGVLKGKFGYMSPEQVRGLPLDRRSDIFALGTMLYECLTGERLFQGETDFSTLEKVRNVDIATPRSINPAIPEQVENVILKALAKDVDDRYQWCSEMLTDLQAYLMGQDVVYTAKSLSSWLKDIFAQEIDRERQQLETYKRVGRDGLIGGLPSAEANKDVVGQLGEAGAPEGDATTLGGPSFDDIEQAIANNAAPSIENVAQQPQQPQRRPQTDDGSNDFGEEAPTEIFGDADPAQQPAAAQRPQPAQRPQTVPPRPPPGNRAPTMQRPQEVPVSASQSGQMAAAANPRPNSGSAPPMPPPPQYAGAAASPAQGNPYPNAYPHPGVLGSDPGASGTPNHMQAQSGLAAPNQGPARTVLGMTAPVMPPQHGQNQTGPNMQPQYGHPNQSGPMQMPQQQQPYGQHGYPQYQQPYPQQGPYPSGSMPGYNQQYNNYGGSGPMQATPIDHLQPQIEGKRSTLVRDILIGVAIAALVLGGFFIVKIFILDKKDEAPTTATQSTIATIHISMAAGITADLIVDDKNIATVRDGNDVPVSAGQRHVVLAGPNGGKCETTVKLEAGKTTPLKCTLASVPATGSDTGSAAVPATGSAATPATGSAATAATGSAAGSAATPPAAGSAAPMTGSAATT
ncbi:MAG TPA: protein kinase, partial [Kofleriaceae bacterium]|nr:protein kinase [Kofleriaceae bacterium]